MATLYALHNRTTGEVVVEQLELAHRFWQRFRGLQLRRALPLQGGLLLVPCRAIHTCFMRFPVDVVALDQTGKVLSVVAQVRPWRVLSLPAATHAVLELPAGSARLAVGDQVGMQSPEAAHLPRAAHFLMADDF